MFIVPSYRKERNMNEVKELTISEEIEKLIYTIREKKVMLDLDVAKLFDTETKKIRQTVKRNIKRFPEDFCFQITESELENIGLQKNEKYRNNRILPYVFTDKGIVMLTLLLKNKIPVQLSINILNTIVSADNFRLA